MKDTVKSIALITILALISSVQLRAAEASGEWMKSAVSTSGQWEIKQGLITLKNLKTGRAPDLKLILSPHGVDDLQSRNAMAGAVVISPLKQSKGTFSFALPEGVDLSNYKSLGIHCERYTKLFAKAAIQKD